MRKATSGLEVIGWTLVVSGFVFFLGPYIIVNTMSFFCKPGSPSFLIWFENLKNIVAALPSGLAALGMFLGGVGIVEFKKWGRWLAAGVLFSDFVHKILQGHIGTRLRADFLDMEIAIWIFYSALLFELMVLLYLMRPKLEELSEYVGGVSGALIKRLDAQLSMPLKIGLLVTAIFLGVATAALLVPSFKLRVGCNVGGRFNAAKDLVGAWSNKESGFKTLGFSLRKDGRGIFVGSVMPTLLRWERTPAGILLKLAGDGQTIELRLTYDTATQTFWYDVPGGERGTFWRISSEEPPDVEAQMEEQQLNPSGSNPPLAVTKVFDCATLELSDGQTVSLIGIQPSDNIEQGKKAAEFIRKLVEGRQVRLEYDARKKDEYGRALAYVYTCGYSSMPEDLYLRTFDERIVKAIDGELCYWHFLNGKIIKEGYAQAMTPSATSATRRGTDPSSGGNASADFAESASPNVKYQDLFAKLEKEAREQRRGLWG